MMYFNDDELSLTASAPPHQFSKEGILFTKPHKKSQKKSKAVKGHGGYVESWFCLKGNLLFCMKGIDRTSGARGVIVLERCSIELDADETDLFFSFVIGQNGGDDRIYLGCKTELDRDEWISALHTASYECMKLQLENLREQISLKTGRDPVTSPHHSANNSTLVSENEAPFIEMCLSCSQLRCATDQQPNCMVDILSLVPPNTEWNLIGQTEIVEQSHNPLFMKTIGIADDQRSSKTRIKLVVYDVREMVTRTRTQIGQAAFILEELMSTKKLTFPIVSPDRSQVGSVNIMSWTTSSPGDCTSSTVPSVPVSLDPADVTDLSVSTDVSDDSSTVASATEGIPGQLWNGDKTYRTRKKDQLKFLFCNTVCKVFRFPTVNKHELSVCEMMSESRLTFVLPVTFLKFLLQDNNMWRDRINHLDSVQTKSDKMRQAISCSLTQFSDYLSTSINFLETKHSKQTFKASVLKEEKMLESIPLNLHINRMLACNQYTKTGSSHDMITIGACAAHHRGFKHGGLAKLLRSHSADSQSFKLPNRSKLSQLLDAVEDLDRLREGVVTSTEDIYRACLAEDGGSLTTAYNALSDQSSQLLELCGKRPLITESMLSFHSSVLLPDQSNSHSAPHGSQSNASKRNSDQSERKSPRRTSHSQEAWAGALSSAQLSVAELIALVKKCVAEIEPSQWLEMISSCKMKCDAFVEKLYSLCTPGLTHATMQQMNNTDPFIANIDLMIRYTAVTSQALTAAVTGVLAKVRFHITDKLFLHQLSNIGCLLHFESLLSCHGSENGMLEDFIVSVQSLADVDFRFTQSSSANDDYLENPPVLTGNRLNFCINMALPAVAFMLLPESLQKGQTFKVIPVMFNIGINEYATIAESVGSTVLQERINRASFELLSSYYIQYQTLFGTVDSTLNSRYSVEELLVKLAQNVNDNKKKNVDVLQISSEICRKLNCVRFISCKSAKDRTAMAITLEECRILQQEHELSPHVFEKAVSCLRSEGVRRQNSFKNTGIMSYALSSFQLLTFPKAYKPPTGTYGKGET